MAPYSGAMLAIVARSASDIVVDAGPEELDELADDAFLAQDLRDGEDKSVAVTPAGNSPVSSKPTTSGMSM